MEQINKKWFWIGGLFSLCFLICIYKLTNASLWFDETIEYYFSRFPIGEIPANASLLETAVPATNMYERIITTFQPPLYNIVMFFWLCINDSEYWFRFFGVLMGIVCAAGIYKSIEKIWNYRIAAISIIILSCTRQFVYYVQECGEYNLVLAGLSWLIFGWICLFEKVTIKRIALFLVSGVIAVYSHYGAIFPVAAFAFTIFLYILIKKNKKEILQISVAYLSTFLIAVLPLWIFFMQKQLANQQAQTEHFFSIKEGIIYDLIEGYHLVIQWCFNYRVVGIFLVLLGIFVLIFSKKKLFKALIVANILCWGIYYVAVKLSFYGYGEFGNRYNLFFLPIWLVTIILNIFETKEIVGRMLRKKDTVKMFDFLLKRKAVFLGVFLSITIAYCSTGWDIIKNNWLKEDIRGAVEKWYDVKAYNISTLVYYGALSGFSFYLEHNEEFEEKFYDNIVTMKNFYRDKTVEEYDRHLNKLYEENWPDRLYLIASHISGSNDLETIIECYTRRGYTSKDVYNYAGGRLIYFIK